MPTLQILIFRHGEKPGDPGQDQPSDGVSLSSRGFARAGALAYLLPDPFDDPDFLFASQASHHSNRPVETITPLSQRLHDMEINSTIADADYATLASQLLTDGKYDGKVIVICWHHGTIPELATSLGVTGAPATWDKTVFDRFWSVDVGAGAATLTDLPQKVLFGDTST
jgi:hypothetical protein